MKKEYITILFQIILFGIIIKEDLEKIFDSSSKKNIDCQKDFYLPIGKNGSFKDYDIKINPDKFFTKHSAILGIQGLENLVQ